ncbi:hypothetical protein [Neobacillus sp. D3-1R]|uniref:hypothetical protein n=1 Tax=Neobacillus sp. D3-1R TaxID=3445778 RepID=UPI003F9F3199
MVSIIYTILLIIIFLILVRKKNDEESNFPLKVIGYFILGSFAFNLNHIALPLGFVIYLLFFHPTLNGHVKRTAAICGVAAFLLVHWILPGTMEAWESRPHFIKQEIESVYTMDFPYQLKMVKEKFKLENNDLKLEDFEVEYLKDGSIKDLSWQLATPNNGKYTIYQIRYELGKNRYRVTKSQADTWFHYDRLIDAQHFFEHIKTLNMKEITLGKGDYPYYVIQSTGERVNYAAEDESLFIVKNGEIQSIDKNQLPVEGYMIRTFAMEKTGEQRNKQGNLTQESFEGTDTSTYFVIE